MGRDPRRDEIPRQVFVPRSLEAAAANWKRSVASEFLFDERDHYTIVLVSDNPDVNFQDEICYFGNMLFLGARPPELEMIIEVKKPSGWKRLEDKYYCKSWREFHARLRHFRKGHKSGVVHQKELRLE